MSNRSFHRIGLACALFAVQIPGAASAADLGGDPMGFEAGFAPHTGANPSAVAAADFDRDGRNDLAVTSYTANTVQVLRGDDSPFTAGATLATGKDPIAAATADLDDDGAPDLVVANY